MLDKQGYMHAHAHAPGYPHARTHRQISNTYCISTTRMTSERASVLRYTYFACLVQTDAMYFCIVLCAALNATSMKLFNDER